MTILLTGATGFTGLFLAKAARAAGHNVVPLPCNLADKPAVEHAVLSIAPDYVVHLAAISFVGHADNSAFYAVNTVGTSHLLDALCLLPQKPHKILIASSANVYGNCEASPLSEVQNPAPVNHYAMSKLAMEYMAHTYMDRLPIVITRPFNYTGVGQAAHFIIPKLVHHYKQRLPVVELGNIHIEREFNDVRVVCNAYLTLLSHGDNGETYNICSGQTYTLAHVMNTLEELVAHYVKPEVNPAFVRANEVHKLCGDPRKFLSLCARVNQPVTPLHLRDMLAWMISGEGT